MYIIEPIANRVLRRSMRSVLRFDDAAGQRMRENPGEPAPRMTLGQGSLERFGDEGAMSQDMVMGSAFAYQLGVSVATR